MVKQVGPYRELPADGHGRERLGGKVDSHARTYARVTVRNTIVDTATSPEAGGALS